MSQVNYDNLKICQRINRLKLTILNLQTVSNIRLQNGGRCKRPRRMPIVSIPSLTTDIPKAGYL